MLHPRPLGNSPRYTLDDADDSSSRSNARSMFGLRLVHGGKSDGAMPLRSAPFAWNSVVPTHRRERAFEGLLWGCGIAEALSLSRNGLHPRAALKLFDRNPLQFQFQPGVGITSQRTHALIMTVQALLGSKTDVNLFVAQLSRRIKWYQLAFSLRYLWLSIKRPLSPKPADDAMSYGVADDPLVRSLVMSIMLQGNLDSASRWFQRSVSITHKDTRVQHASVLIGYAAQFAQMTEPDDLDPIAVITQLIDATDEKELSQMLLRLREGLEHNRSVAFMAKSFGWANGLPSDVFAGGIMGLYGWLRHPKRFRHSVERTILLGGECSAATVVAGGLAGIHLGKRAMPTEWVRKLSLFPYSSEWTEHLIERVKDWPHGVEDIQRTSTMPSLVLGQIARNCIFSCFQVIHAAIRLPVRIGQFSLVKRTK